MARFPWAFWKAEGIYFSDFNFLGVRITDHGHATIKGCLRAHFLKSKSIFFVWELPDAPTGTQKRPEQLFRAFYQPFAWFLFFGGSVLAHVPPFSAEALIAVLKGFWRIWYQYGWYPGCRPSQTSRKHYFCHPGEKYRLGVHSKCRKQQIRGLLGRCYWPLW